MADEPDCIRWSNDVRLSVREWGIAGMILAVVFLFVPVVWERVEPLEVTPGYRVPYSLSNDYWTFNRYCRRLANQKKVFVIGDSVIWGHYVSGKETLSEHLNAVAGEGRFANAGVDGLHPAALAGLIKYYGRAIRNQNVILHCNLLWMSSKRRDLQIEKEQPINHATLIPQFVPRIPCYREPISGKLALVVERFVPFCGWANHMRFAYFGGTDVPGWSLGHPYKLPVTAISLKLPGPGGPASPTPARGTSLSAGVARSDFPWVEIGASFQWRRFQRSIDILQDRGNNVFVLVGPFNEHVLGERSLKVYRQRRREVAAALRQKGIAHAVPPVLPDHLYADASHPIDKGYARVATWLMTNEAFIRFNARARG